MENMLRTWQYMKHFIDLRDCHVSQIWRKTASGNNTYFKCWFIQL